MQNGMCNGMQSRSTKVKFGVGSLMWNSDDFMVIA